MRTIKMISQPVHKSLWGHDDKGEKVKPDDISSFDVILKSLANSAMKASGDKLMPPHYGVFDSLIQHRRAGKVMAKMQLLEEGKDLRVSDEEYEVVKKCVEENPYMPTAWMFVLDLIDTAQEDAPEKLAEKAAAKTEAAVA